MGNTILSNHETASGYAQGIMNGANSIESSVAVTKDGTTTLSGNSLAGSEIDKESNMVTTISSQIKSFITNVHSIATEFEAVDTKLAETISEDIGVPALGVSSFDPFSNGS